MSLADAGDTKETYKELEDVLGVKSKIQAKTPKKRTESESETETESEYYALWRYIISSTVCLIYCIKNNRLGVFYTIDKSPYT